MTWPLLYNIEIGFVVTVIIAKFWRLVPKTTKFLKFSQSHYVLPELEASFYAISTLLIVQ